MILLKKNFSLTKSKIHILFNCPLLNIKLDLAKIEHPLSNV